MSVAVLFTTHFLNASIIKRFQSIDVDDGYKKWLLHDCGIDSTEPKMLEPIQSQLVRTSYQQIIDSGFKPTCNKMIPGNNHFLPLEFMASHSEYSHIWVVEYDVCYTGSWRELFSTFDPDIDFLSTKIRRPADTPNWPHWSNIKPPIGKTVRNRLLASFNPIYRLSRDSALHLRKCFLSGWVGHHEVTIPTLLHHAGFSIEDIGDTGEFTPNHRLNKFYSKKTFRWRPAIVPRREATQPNTLYHPVK